MSTPRGQVPFRAYWAILSQYLNRRRLSFVALAFLLFSGIGLQLVGPQTMKDVIDGALAGKAVLCEKPLTLNADQATQLFDEAETHGVFLMEALWTYFLPALVEARRWWTSGAIGEVRFVEASFGFAAPYEPEGRMYNPALAGGALLDVGVYVLSMAQLVAGQRVPKVKASQPVANRTAVSNGACPR